MKKIQLDRTLLEQIRPRHAAIALFVVAFLSVLSTRETALGYVFCAVLLVAGICVERILASEEKQLDASLVIAMLDAFQHACQMFATQEHQGATAGLVLMREGMATRPAELHDMAERFLLMLTPTDMADLHALVSPQTAKSLNLDELDEFTQTCDNLRETTLNFLRAPRGGLFLPSRMFTKRWKNLRKALTGLNAKFVPPAPLPPPPAAKMP